MANIDVEGFVLMDDEILSKLVVGLIASVFTFILGVIYTSHIQRKQFRLSFKSFLTVSLIKMKNDFHKIHKGDGNVRHVITQNYKVIRDHYNINKNEPLPDLSYLSLKNLGPGVIMQCKIDAKYFVDNCDYKWNVECSIDVIEKDERVYMCIDDIKAPVGTFFLDQVDIEYKTQADQWVVLCMKYSMDEKSYSIKYKTKSFWIFKKSWIQIHISSGLEWEAPNK